MKTAQNFMNFIKPLYYFDALLTGKGWMDRLKISNDQVDVIKSLIDWKLGKQSSAGFDEYVLRTFEAYTRNKKQIEIRLLQLRKSSKSMRQLIFHSLQEYKQPKDKNDKTNLLRADIAKLFPNVNTVHISAILCSFSLFGLMRVIHETQWKQIIVKGSWLLESWESNKQAIEEEYAADYNFEYNETSKTLSITSRSAL